MDETFLVSFQEQMTKYKPIKHCQEKSHFPPSCINKEVHNKRSSIQIFDQKLDLFSIVLHPISTVGKCDFDRQFLIRIRSFFFMMMIEQGTFES